MATLRQIADLGAALKSAIDALQALKDQKQAAQDAITVLNTQITAQQAVVDKAQADLKAALP